MSINLIENVGTLKSEILKRIKVTNENNISIKIEKSLEKLNRISNDMTNIDIKTNFFEKYANYFYGATDEMSEVIIKLTKLKNIMLEGIRFQTQLYLICNDVKDVIMLIDKFDFYGLDIIFGIAKSGNFNNLQSIVDEYGSENNTNKAQCKADGYFLIEYLQSFDDVLKIVQDDIQNLIFPNELDLNVNYEIQRVQTYKYSVILPILLAVFSYFGSSFGHLKFKIPTSTLVFIICAYFGWRQVTKNYGNNHRTKLIDLSRNIQAAQTSFEKFVSSIDHARTVLSEKIHELKGFGFLMLGWKHSQTNFEVSRRDKSHEHLKDERLIEMVKNLGDSTRNIVYFYNISNDDAWLMIEFLNNCHNRKIKENC